MQGASITVGGIEGNSRKQERSKAFVKPGGTTYAHAPHGIAMIRGIQANERFLLFLRGTLLLPILNRHFQGHFHGRGAVVRVEHPRQASRGDFDEFPGQENGGGTGCAQQRAMGNFAELLLNGRVQLTVSVSVKIDPNG